ncbi:hypothetical protein G7Y89_g9723 [Cudoniella acicularis]|uniref:AAA+ ATPase domain-containing protein n=1 Tax=Cudoniella acicularis TaxID=354080 RepID=A0A8H4RE46_9HELO|nr:hypothetical protein G7Y89_g9723 [Cudoniella acicularis]
MNEEISIQQKTGVVLETVEIHEKVTRHSEPVSELVTDSPAEEDTEKPIPESIQESSDPTAIGAKPGLDYTPDGAVRKEVKVKSQSGGIDGKQGENDNAAEEAGLKMSTPADDEAIRREIRRPVNLGVRFYSYSGFMNRVDNDGRDEKTRISRAPGQISSTPQIASESENLGENLRIYRVRIRSKEILRHLWELGDWDEGLDFAGDVKNLDDEIIFSRPFRALASFQEDMKRKVEEMETTASKISLEGGQLAITQPASHQGQRDNEILQASNIDNLNLPATASASNKFSAAMVGLQEMKCYVKFVDEKILPLWSQFEKVDKHTPRKVTYEEISIIFRTGDLVYVPSPPTNANSLHRSAVQNVFCMGCCVPGDTPHKLKGETWNLGGDHKIKVLLFCVDYEGEKFRAIWDEVRFKHFEGEREITSLECYPLRFHKSYEALLNHQIETGTRFKSFVEGTVKHYYYSGWTMATGMFQKEGETPPDDLEHIDSEVIIDMKEAASHMTEYRPLEDPVWDYAGWQTRDEVLPFRIWQGNGSQFHAKPVPLVTREDPIYGQDQKRLFKDREWDHNDFTFSPQTWTDQDLAILPKRLLGYVVRERKFARLDVKSFDMMKDEDQITLENIQMKKEHRTIIRSTIMSHFQKKEREKTSDVPIYNPDVIRGKGKGVVILLHGAPGVGKTATAEAVALENRKPLFPITCGDLGTSAEDVEKRLKDIFRYAHMWDCILLLDEADVFLTQRDRTDVERNALVSVFLRVLEYYSGILFLTTNRVGALDEAFRSRVHISLYYRDLTCDDTVAILKTNLARLPRADKLDKGTTPGNAHIQVMDNQIENFVKNEFRKHAKAHKKGPWNGRQIRNAVQIATCLAFFENQSSGNSLPAVLTAEHFRTVAETTAEFDRYLKKTRRADESKIAHMQGDRYDEAENVDEAVQYHGFTGRKDLGPNTLGRKFKQSTESQESTAGAARALRTSVRSVKALPSEDEEDQSDYYNSSGRNTREYPSNIDDAESVEDYDEDEHEMSLNGPSAGRSSERGDSARKSMYRSGMQVQRGGQADNTFDMEHPYQEDEHFQDWNENEEMMVQDSRHGSGNLPKLSRGRGYSWDSKNSTPLSRGRSKLYGKNTTPSRAQNTERKLEQRKYESTNPETRGTPTVSTSSSWTFNMLMRGKKSGRLGRNERDF